MPLTASGDVDDLDGCRNASYLLCFSICTYVPVMQVNCLLHATYTPLTASGDVDGLDGHSNASHLLRRNRPRYSLTRLLHASYTPRIRLVTLFIFSAETVPGTLLHASYTPRTRLVYAS